MLNYINFLLRWRKSIALVILWVIGIMTCGVTGLEFSTSYRVFFSKDNPQLIRYQTLQKDYLKNDNILFVIVPKNQQIFSKESLDAVRSLTRDAWNLPFVRRVDSLSNFPHSFAAEDTIVVEDLIKDSNPLTAEDRHRIRNFALHDPQLVGRLLAPSEDVTGVNVTFDILPSEEQEATKQAVSHANRLVEQFRISHPDMEIYLTGIVMMDNALTAIPLNEMKTLIPLMFMVVFVILALLLRNFSATLAALLILLLSIGGTMGMAGWFKLVLSPPSVVAPIVIMTLAVADCVHMLVNFQETLVAGQVKQVALQRTFQLNLKPIFLTSLTTTIGFLGLNFSDVPPFQDLGNLVAAGSVLAFILTVSFLPALLMILPVQKVPQNCRGNQTMRQLGVFVSQRPDELLWCIGSPLVILVFFVTQNKLNDEFVKYFDHSVEFRQAADFAVERLTGLYILEYEVATGIKDKIMEPRFTSMVENFSEWFREQPEVLHVNTLTDVLKRVNKNLHNDNPSQYRLPKTRELTAQSLLLYEMSLPYGLDLADRINSDNSAMRISASLSSLPSSAILALEKRAQTWFDRHAETALTATASGAPLMFAHISARNIRSMLAGTAWAVVGISLLLILALRSFRLGMLSLASNLAPAFLAFGVWGIVVGTIGMTLAVVACLTFGLVVDDTVHFLSKYVQLRRGQGFSPALAVQSAFSSVGTALWVTSLVLIAGFFILSFSAFIPNADMGLMACITIIFALVVDFLVIPPLLILLDI